MPLPSNDNILNMLGVPSEYATPQQLADLSAYAQSELPTAENERPIGSYTEMASGILRAINGSMVRRSVAQQQSKAMQGTFNSATTMPGMQQAAAPAPVKNAALDGGIINPQTFMAKLFGVESGGDPRAQTGKLRNDGSGSRTYRGLGQLSKEEELKYGINDSNYTDKNLQMKAIQGISARNAAHFQATMGRKPTDGELYLMHQQGIAGAPALLQQPNIPAWLAVRKYYPTDAKAKEVISGNIPDTSPLKNKPIDQITAGEFASLWTSKFDGGGLPQVAADTGPMPGFAPPAMLGGDPANTLPADPAAQASQTVAAAGNAPSVGAAAASAVGGQGAPVDTAAAGAAGTVYNDGAAPTAGYSAAAAPIETAAIPPVGDVGGNVAPPPIATPAAENVAAPISGIPKPPPPMGGFSPDELRHMVQSGMPPEMLTKILENRQAMYTPMITDIPGVGKVWQVPATRQSGFIPNITNEKTKIGNMELNTRITPDLSGNVSSEFVIPGQGTGGGNTAPPTDNKGGDLFTPSMQFPKSGNLNDIKEWERQQASADEARKGASTGNVTALRKPLVDSIDAGAAAAQTKQVLGAMKSLEKIPQSKNIWTGPGANQWQQIRQIFQNLGYGNNFDQTIALSTSEAYTKLNTILATASTKELTSRPAQMEFAQYLKTNPGPLMSPTGRKMMIDILEQSADQKIKIGNIANELLQTPEGMQAFQGLKAKVYDQQPLEFTIPPDVQKEYDAWKKKQGAPTSGGDTYEPGKGWR